MTRKVLRWAMTSAVWLFTVACYAVVLIRVPDEAKLGIFIASGLSGFVIAVALIDKAKFGGDDP